MKCRYYSVCKIVSDRSMLCTIDGGGIYCGRFRSLSARETQNAVEKRKIRKLARHEFLKKIFLVKTK